MKKDQLKQSAIEIVNIIRKREPLDDISAEQVAKLIELLAVRHSSQEGLKLTDDLQEAYYGKQ